MNQAVSTGHPGGASTVGQIPDSAEIVRILEEGFDNYNEPLLWWLERRLPYEVAQDVWIVTFERWYEDLHNPAKYTHKRLAPAGAYLWRKAGWLANDYWRRQKSRKTLRTVSLSPSETQSEQEAGADLSLEETIPSRNPEDDPEICCANLEREREIKELQDKLYQDAHARLHGEKELETARSLIFGFDEECVDSPSKQEQNRMAVRKHRVRKKMDGIWKSTVESHTETMP